MKCRGSECRIFPYLCKFDDFSTAEAELLVVVQDSVHVLDPHGVHGAVKQEPPLVLVCGPGAHADQGRQDTIRPRHRFTGGGIISQHVRYGISFNH